MHTTNLNTVLLMIVILLLGVLIVMVYVFMVQPLLDVQDRLDQLRENLETRTGSLQSALCEFIPGLPMCN